MDMGPRLEAFVNPADARPLRKPTSVPSWLAAACCCWQRRDRRGGRRTSYQVGVSTTVSRRRSGWLS